MVGRGGSVAECAREEPDIFSHLCFSSFLRVNRGCRGFDARWRLYGRRAVTSSCRHLHHEDCLLLECGIHLEHVDSSGLLHLCALPLEYVAPSSGRRWQSPALGQSWGGADVSGRPQLWCVVPRAWHTDPKVHVKPTTTRARKLKGSNTRVLAQHFGLRRITMSIAGLIGGAATC